MHNKSYGVDNFHGFCCRLCDCEKFPTIIFHGVAELFAVKKETHKEDSSQVIETRHEVDTGAEPAKHTVPSATKCIIIYNFIGVKDCQKLIAKVFQQNVNFVSKHKIIPSQMICRLW